MNTTGNTILITGGTSGIGLAFAEYFLSKDNTVIICGRRADRLAALTEKHPALITRICDIADQQERVALATWATTTYPALNVLMNNAGMQLATDLTQPMDLDKLRQENETNFIAPVHLASLFTAHLRAVKDPYIINITSGLAFAPLAFMPVYCATKAAMHSFTMSLRHQLKPLGITVIEVVPPSVDTELGHERRADKTQSHGGIPISEFLTEAVAGLESGVPEVVVGMSIGLKAKREELFDNMNRH